MSDLSSTSPTADLQTALIELIYSGGSLADRLATIHSEYTYCMCGLFRGPSSEPDNHANAGCPVARYYRAVAAVERAVRS